MAEFGAGPKLTKELDFEVDSTGDLKTDRGFDELAKDLSLFSISSLRSVKGELPNDQTKAKAESIARSVFLNDPRVDRVREIESSISPIVDGSSEVTIKALIVADGEEQELVFSV